MEAIRVRRGGQQISRIGRRRRKLVNATMVLVIELRTRVEIRAKATPFGYPTTTTTTTKTKQTHISPQTIVQTKRKNNRLKTKNPNKPNMKLNREKVKSS